MTLLSLLSRQNGRKGQGRASVGAARCGLTRNLGLSEGGAAVESFHAVPEECLSSLRSLRACLHRPHISPLRAISLHAGQRDKPATLNALECAPGSQPRDHTDTSRALLKQTIILARCERAANQARLQTRRGVNFNNSISLFHSQWQDITLVITHTPTNCLCVVSTESAARAARAEPLIARESP